MANYTQTNIYRKQMQELGVNTKQYAKLIDMPYEVVKDIIYDKDGDYSMDIKNILRGNMFNKHQEIENNIEMAKLKATEIKCKENVDIRKWYEKEYTPKLLKDTLHLTSIVEFKRNYDIMINGKRASNWFYSCLVGKVNYDNHEVRKEVQEQFIEQLYDIIVNDNGEKYKRETPTEIKEFPTKRKPIKNKDYKNEYFKWFRDFDIKAFIKKHKLNNTKLSNELGIGVVTTSYLVSKRHYTRRTLEKLYNYVKKIETNNELTNDIDDWYYNFNFKKYLLDNNLTQTELYKKFDVERNLFNRIINHNIKNLTNRKRIIIQKLYDYITSDSKQTITESSKDLRTAIINGNSKKIDELNNVIFDKVYENEIKQFSNNDDIEILDDEQDDNNTTTLFERNDKIEDFDTNSTLLDNSASDKVDNSTRQIEIEHDNNAILRMILVKRLTDEEKLLIELFGGKIC